MAKSISKLENQSAQCFLEHELDRLKQMLEIDDGLKVTWMPDSNGKLSGEVKGKRIYIYEVDPTEAAKTLHHEVIDYLICQAIEPYKQVTNALIRLLNENAYKDKENIVEKICALLK